MLTGDQFVLHQTVSGREAQGFLLFFLRRASKHVLLVELNGETIS